MLILKVASIEIGKVVGKYVAQFLLAIMHVYIRLEDHPRFQGENTIILGNISTVSQPVGCLSIREHISKTKHPNFTKFSIVTEYINVRPV